MTICCLSCDPAFQAAADRRSWEVSPSTPQEAVFHRGVSLSASGEASGGPAPAGGRSPLPFPSTLSPLSHLMRWRTSEDSSVISPKLFLRRHGTTSSSSRTMRTMAQTAIRV